jgi:hypothetical protein
MSVVTRIPLILDDRIRLVNLTARLRDKLLENGFKVVPDGSGHPSVLFNPNPINILENPPLISLLNFLAKNGVAFESDYKQMYSPCYTMKLLRENGLYQGAIIECEYDGKNWIYNEL